MHEKLLEIKTLIQKNEQEKAENIIRSLETVSIRDNLFHLDLVNLCEELGIIEKIPGELHLALRDSPENPGILKKLAHFYLDSGNLDKAEKYFRKTISLAPFAPEPYGELWHILEEKKDLTALQELSLKIKELFPSSELANLEAELIEEREDEIPEGEEMEVPDDSKLIRFVSLFSGREGIYARQWISPTGEAGYTPVYEPFNYKVAKNHILGNYTVGIYQLRVDNTVNFIAFDIDITKKYLSKIMSDKTLWKGAIKNAHSVACKIIDLLSSKEIPLYLESSGYKGRHCWIFLQSPISAKIARAFALNIADQIAPLPEGIEVEIFPKQEYVKSGGTGNLIKIPLGIHRKTGRRSEFIDPKTGQPYEEQLSFLESVIKCPREKILSFAPTVEIKETPEEVVTEERPAPLIKSPQEEYELDTDREFQYLLLKCSVLNSLYDKIKTHNELTNEEIIIISHSVGHLTHGPEAVNSLLKLCPGTGDRYFLKSRLRGNPVSCPKIRAKIPDTTSKLDCNCKFENYPDMYPTPVLHVQDLNNPSVLPGSTIDQIQFQVLVQDYLNTRKQMKQLNERYKNQQKLMDSFFDQAGITSVQTSFGLLKRIAQDDKVNYLLEM